MAETIKSKLENGRAEAAYTFVENAVKELSDKSKDYSSHIKKLATMLLINGLGQTVVFIKAKSQKDKAYKIIYNQLQEYFKSDIVNIKINNNEDLVKWIISHNSSNYRQIAQETLSLFKWLKRFAEGMIEEE